MCVLFPVETVKVCGMRTCSGWRGLCRTSRRVGRGVLRRKEHCHAPHARCKVHAYNFLAYTMIACMPQVRCQSDGLSAAAVLQQLAVQGKRNALRQLYNGFGTAAVLSIFVGAVHYASFCVTRRLALQAGASDAAAVPASGGGGGHGAAHQPEGSTTANLFAAAVGAMATALVESPAELLRHQAQAGMPVENVAHAFKTGGVPGVVGALYGGSFIPFLIESFPYDLMVRGAGRQAGSSSGMHRVRGAAAG